MSKALSTAERASRQRIMMSLRSWMESEGVTRRDVAAEMDITEGHLRTLLNANRTASEEQCQKARVIMGVEHPPHPKGPRRPKVVKPAKKTKKDSAPKKKPAAEPKITRKAKPNKLRPMTQFETKFVTDVATAWIEANLGASKEKLVEVVRALSIGIRT